MKKFGAMRALLVALMLMIGSQAGAGCGNLCDNSWWETATEADVQAELGSGADLNLIDEDAVPKSDDAFIDLLLSVQTLPSPALRLSI